MRWMVGVAAPARQGWVVDNMGTGIKGRWRGQGRAGRRGRSEELHWGIRWRQRSVKGGGGSVEGAREKFGSLTTRKYFSLGIRVSHRELFLLCPISYWYWLAYVSRYHKWDYGIGWCKLADINHLLYRLAYVSWYHYAQPINSPHTPLFRPSTSGGSDRALVAAAILKEIRGSQFHWGIFSFFL
jgi:hypothetical protein